MASLNKPFPFHKVNGILEKGTINVSKLPDRDGFERRAFFLNKQPMKITTPKFKYKCSSIDEIREEVLRIEKLFKVFPCSDEEDQTTNEISQHFENAKKDRNEKKFNVNFNVTGRDIEYNQFVEEMELLGQTLKEKFDKHFNCEVEGDILKTFQDESISYPHTYKEHPRRIRFCTSFFAIEEGSIKTLSFIKRDGKMVKIDTDLENFYNETKGEMVNVRFTFTPMIYSKNGKFFMENEVIAIEFSELKYEFVECPFLEDSDED